LFANGSSIAAVSAVHRLPGKHFLQEDQAPGIAEHVARLAAPARG